MQDNQRQTQTRDKWNEKYRQRSEAISEPDDFLVRNQSRLQVGDALDLACGDGRNSLFLARNGFRVRAVDISDVALSRLAKTAKHEHLVIETSASDLESADTSWMVELSRYDTIAVINYLPTPEVIRSLPTLLRPGGVLAFCTFNMRHHEATGFKKDFCLKSEKIESIPAELELIHFEDFHDAKGYRYGYLFSYSACDNPY